jgi:glycosyltransferase involved in cell wall biosynthesis
MKKKLRIAICAPNESSSSETFIANHVHKLQGEIFFLYGGWIPTSYQGNSLLKRYQEPTKGLATRILRRLKLAALPKKLDGKIAFELFLKEFKIDVVLAEYGITGVHVGPICKKLNIPFVTHFHGFDAYHFETLKANGENYRTLLKDSASVIAVSEHMKKQLGIIGIPEEKIVLIHYGVDVEMFSLAEKKSFNETFLAVGRFVTKKAPHLTILAFAEVLKEFGKAHLIMAGDAGLGNSNELLIACKQLVKALRIDAQVTFTGAVSQKEISLLMKKSTVFVQHSVTSDTGDSEGTPNSVIEASASGLCVVSTKHAGIPDVVVQGETGFLCDEFDFRTMPS